MVDNQEPKVVVEGLSIRFRLSYDKAFTTAGRMRQMAKRVIRSNPPELFTALEDVSLAAESGDIIGLIGPNGSGKTTFLRAVSGIYRPDAGTVAVSGRLSTLLSLGTGFDNNLSGHDNILLSGLLIGMQPAEIESRVPEIVAFAGVEEFIDVPMKYYSSGMISRLSFAIVLSMEPDVVLIDEVFSVGDLAFKKKSEAAMHDMLSRASIQLIVTHDLSLVRDHCNRAVMFRGGRVVEEGDPADVVSSYEKWSADRG
ncbi:Polysaccharide ABC transporter, ATP-binding protein [Euzebya pacifica]|uniref:Polysaccharide ABC transporter, ATP-binding protein n=1 Tax=Euzebya pacifica TaxID=1608957 RepID=A0A346XW18_9ACTN|nr:ATP-binding cassette domain-containing protein [Euzebya pacifica]AXV06415.1 Polysaccharide ABC transporter, ATP-binding protein [Euzebya pacifica]